MPTDLASKLSACDRLAAAIGLPPHILARLRAKVERGHEEHGHEPPPVAMEELPPELCDVLGYVAVDMAQRPGEPILWKHRRCAQAAAELLLMLEGPDDEDAYLLEATQRNMVRTILGWPWLPHDVTLVRTEQPAANGLPPHPWREADPLTDTMETCGDQEG